jgi:preprotein translocase subunit Sss1
MSEDLPMENDDRTITEEDLALLNRTQIGRSATLARHVGTGLIALGCVGMLAWLWMEVRSQQNLGTLFGSPGDGFEQPSLPFIDRVSIFSSLIVVVIEAGVLIGVGFLLRLLADHVQLAHGISPLGLEVGDPWPESGAAEEADIAAASDDPEDEEATAEVSDDEDDDLETDEDTEPA